MHSDINYLYLKNHSVMEGIRKENLYEILNQGVFFRKKKGDYISISNDSVPKIFFLIKGKVKIFEKEDKEIIKYISSGGSLFGNYTGLQLISDDMAKVISDEAIYFTLNQSTLEILVSSTPKLALNISKAYSLMFLKSQQKHKMMAFNDVRERVLDFFKNWAEEEGEVQGSKTVIKNYLTHKDIAAIVCTCRQTVTTILNELKRKGIISYSRREIIIEDLSKIYKAA